MWDYEGKLDIIADIINARLESPPAKIICALLTQPFHSFSQNFRSHIQPLFQLHHPRPHLLTRDIPFSPLELKAETGSAATKADDAGIDLSVWA